MTVEGDLPVLGSLVIPGDELAITASRSGGPGGQNVNKLSTKVTLRWSVASSRALSDGRRARLFDKLASRLTKDGELVLSSDEGRSQFGNRRAVRERLVELVRQALHVPKARRKTKPTKASKRRRLEGKTQRSEVKRQRRRPGHDD